MDIVKLKKQIKDKQLAKLYIFTGEEIGLMNMYINKMGTNVIRADEVQDVWPKITARTFSDDSAIYVVRDDKKFLGLEKVWTGLQDKLKSGTLVLCFTSLDKRSKFYKQFQDEIVVFDKMTEAQILQHCKKRLPGVDAATLKYLAYLCNYDYTRVENEIDKLNRLNKPITEGLLADIIIPPKDSTAFTYVDAILTGDAYNAIYDADTLLSNGESGVMLLGLLYSNFRNAILVVGNKDGNHGVNGYVARNLKEKLVYKPAELLAILRIIQKYERGIKIGEYEEKFALKAATLEILCI